MKDLKYLMAYIVPLVIFISLYLRGYWSFFALVVLFGLIPALEFMLPGTTENMDKAEEDKKKNARLFDYLLYLNVPIQYGLLGYFLYIFASQPLAGYEIAGLILAMGMGCGSLGINVAHELGHRKLKYEQYMAQSLLLTSLYMHFFIEHNRGHHKYVATPLDPATARKGETLYHFWWRSIRDGYLSAWRIENNQLRKKGQPVFSSHNQMVRFQLIQLGFVLVIGMLFGWMTMLAFLAAALIGILELETVNYLEHYGLVRRELRPGIYERVQPSHSWNSNQSIGRILLYELTRHADHHYLASRKYQTLRHFENSPQLPTGYPAMMILALAPPIWFKVMHKRLSDYSSPMETTPQEV